MNILVIGKFYPEGFALHIAESLSDLGHAVRRFEPGFGFGSVGGPIGRRLNQVRGVIHSSTDNLPSVRARRMRKLWQTAEIAPLDGVIVCHDFLWPKEVAELKERTGAQVSMWFPDALVNFGRGYFMNAPYDALFFKDPFIIRALSDVLKSPVYYLPECFNPKQHWLAEKELKKNDPAYECDITTAGNQHSWRVACYRHLHDYRVKLWGNPPPLWMPSGPVGNMYQGRAVFNHEKARAFRGAKIVVNNLHYGEIWGVNVRCFEAAGAGAFQIVDWRPSLSHLFEDGKELISYRGMADLRKKIGEWLPREDERRAIGEAGMRRAHAEHTYSIRLELLLNTLGGSARGFPVPNIVMQHNADSDT
jgi:spore maturation protein CgeB